MRIEWDELKRARNLLPPPKGHSLDFEDARQRFAFDEAAIVPSYPGPDGRPRYIAIGWLDEHFVAAVFSPLGTEAISLISLRPANRRERRIYDEAQG